MPPAIAQQHKTFEAPGFETFPRPELILGGGETTAPIGQLHAVETIQDHESVVFPGVIKVSELPGDRELVAGAQQMIRMRLVGGLAVAETVNIIEKPIKNIHEGIVWASRGDAEGIAMTDANIGTEMVEQAYKAGNVVKIRLQTDHRGIYQNGQLLDDVQRNAFQLASDDPIIKPRTEAEANNAARMKRLYDAGVLEDYAFVRFSMCAEGVSDEKLDELKFFSTTKSLSVQMAYSENGQLVDDVAMVAGATSKDAARHDRKMVEGIAERFNMSYKGMSAAEILDDGLLIPKEYVKNRVVDLVRIMDDINGGTFYGQDEKRQDYVEHREFCERRAERFADDVAEVRNQLIGEVNNLKTASVTSRRLAKLVEQKMVNKALTDKSIDPIVFGAESAKSLNRARELTAAGKHHEAQAFMQIALAKAKGGSCPSALLAKAGLNGVNVGETDSESDGPDGKGPLQFKCPQKDCGYINTRPLGGLLDCCKECKKPIPKC